MKTLEDKIDCGCSENCHPGLCRCKCHKFNQPGDLIRNIEALRMELSKSKCRNAESELFGRCFSCENTKGYNRALDDVLETIKNKPK